MMTTEERNKRIEDAYSTASQANELLDKIAIKSAQLNRDVKKLKNELSDRLAEQGDRQQK